MRNNVVSHGTPFCLILIRLRLVLLHLAGASHLVHAIFIKNSVMSQTLAIASCRKRNYIFSGADTPIKRNALAIVVCTAVINAKRASVSSLLSALITFSAP